MPSARSITKVCPSRRSKSKTPWCAKHSTPVMHQLVGHRAAPVRWSAGRPAALPPGLPGREGVGGGAYVVHPQAPHAQVARAAAPGPRARARARRAGAGVPSGPASRVPRKLLRLAPTSSGRPSARDRVEVGQQLPVVLAALGEAEPGVEHDAVGVDARGRRRVEALAELVDDGGHDAAGTVVRREVGHPVAVRAPVHGDVRRVGARDDVEDRRVGQAARDVVDDAARRRRARPRRPRRAWCRRRRPRPAAASPEMTGTTRSSSSATTGRVAPGRVDSPPTSRTSAPWASSSRPWASADAVSAYRPPSLKESGVTLTIPITRGRWGWLGASSAASGSAPSPRSAWRRCA